MASNNTDHAFGEVRDTQNAQETVAIAFADVESGVTMHLKTAGDGKAVTVEEITGDQNVYGVTRFAAKAGKPVVLLQRGITRLRNKGSNSQPSLFASPVAMNNGKLSTPTNSLVGRAFGVNIGGDLANNDTGLFFIDCIAGIMGGQET